MMRTRDANLPRLIKEHRARVLVEIGVGRCRSSLRMIAAAAEIHGVAQVEYHGFDVFREAFEREFWAKEFCKPPHPIAEAEKILADTGAKVHLHEGLTQTTLPAFFHDRYAEPVDFVWLDGGHTADQVGIDWYWARELMGPHTVVLFDDYAVSPPGALPWGPTQVVDGIDRASYMVDILEPGDEGTPTMDGETKRTMHTAKVMRR